MLKIVLKYMYFTDWQIGETESWLSDMSEQGLHLKKFSSKYAVFERGKSERYRYRISFGEQGYGNSLPENFKQYEENGWQLVHVQGAVWVFRSPESANIPEIHNPFELGSSLQKLNRKRERILAIILGAGAVYLIYTFFFSQFPMLSIIESRGLSAPIYLMFYIVISIFSIQSTISTRKFERSLREGKTIDHNADWRNLQCRRKLSTVTFHILFWLIISFRLVMILQHRPETLPYENNDSRIIRLADIENDPELERREGLYSRGVDYGNFVRSKRSLSAPVFIEVHERGKIPGRQWADSGAYIDGRSTYEPRLDFELFQLRFSWVTDMLLQDLFKRVAEGFHFSFAPVRIAPAKNIEHSEFDRLYLRVETDVPELEIIAIRGKHVIRLMYYGEKDLDSVLFLVKDLFDRLA